MKGKGEKEKRRSDGETTRFRARASEFARRLVAFSPLLVFSLSLLTACASLEKPKSEPFYSAAPPTARKEFRWSNGARLPKSFDPARAAAAPETDVARALFEGLTDTDARTLKTVPAIAVDWSSSDGDRTWTFKLRGDARWTNGERITAGDFARAWKRAAALGSGNVPHFDLLTNIVGVETAKAENNSVELDLFSQKDLNKNLPPLFKRDAEAEAAPKTDTNRQSEAESKAPPTNDAAAAADESTANGAGKKTGDKKDEPKTGRKTETAFGAVAIDDFTLRVSLLKPDKDFPALVAHPVFRPVFGDGKSFDAGRLNADVVTSGAFRVAGVSQTNGVTLERSETFWNKNQVALERVSFVPAANAESALEAYRAGEIDAVTNHDFEPLAQKLLTPFDDFERTPHAALNFYEFNRARAPFDDKRVREALTIAVERERLTQDEMDGASVPAFDFLPFDGEKNLTFSQNVERARNLLAAAGYANGENFPVVRLVVNRNNLQQKIARAAAKMWKQNLNVETEIVAVENADIEAARAAGDFDVLRRGAIFATTDERANMSAIFAAPENQSAETSTEKSAGVKAAEENMKSGTADSQAVGAPSAFSADAPTANQTQNQRSENSVGASSASPAAPATRDEDANASREISTEAEAMNEFAAIPLYFPTSLSLVKPYVRGFDANTLDAPSLQNISIDNDWQPNGGN